VSRFHLDHFRKAERMLAHARTRDLQVSLMLAPDVADRGVDPFGKANMDGADEQRYYRHCVARFGAFANVWWDLINEWHLRRDEAWVNKMGALVKEWDPYDHTTSLHSTGKCRLGHSPWVDYVMFQSWGEHGAYDFLLKARQDRIAAGRPQGGRALPRRSGGEGTQPHPGSVARQARRAEPTKRLRPSPALAQRSRAGSNG
jgi:hypothetical protein